MLEPRTIERLVRTRPRTAQMNATPGFVRFGQFTFDLLTLELGHRGRPVPLQPQPARVLALLVRNAGRVVTRDELRQHLWAEAIVDYEKGLNTAVRQVRDALGERAGAPAFVETLPRRGYRFIAPVVVLDEQPPPPLVTSMSSNPAVATAGSQALGKRWTVQRAGWWILAVALLSVLAIFTFAPLGSSSEAGPRVLVLPFTNLTTDPDLEVLAGGLSEEVRAYLAGLDPDRIGVIARTSAERYANAQRTIAEMSAALDVDYVLEGSIQVEGRDIRLTTRLVSGSSEALVWQDRHVGSVAGTLAHSTVVGQRVASSVVGESGVRQATSHPWSGPRRPADRLTYLKARHFLSQPTPSAVRRAIGYFEEVIRADPDFALGYSGLAEARLRARDPHGARSVALKALVLDSGLAEAHRVLGALRLTRDFDPRAAGPHFRKAIALAPGRPDELSAYAFFLFLSGDRTAALHAVAQVSALDPLSAALNGDVGIYYYWAGRHDEAIRYCRLAAELDSTHVYARRCLVNVFEASGRRDNAVEQLGVLMALEGATIEEVADVLAQRANALPAYRAWRLQTLESQPSNGHVLLERARLYAADGSLTDALSCLETAFEDPPLGLVTIAVDPVFHPLKMHPRFRVLLDRIGLDTA